MQSKVQPTIAMSLRTLITLRPTNGWSRSKKFQHSKLHIICPVINTILLWPRLTEISLATHFTVSYVCRCSPSSGFLVIVWHQCALTCRMLKITLPA